jgi:hypothetical protein
MDPLLGILTTMFVNENKSAKVRILANYMRWRIKCTPVKAAIGLALLYLGNAPLELGAGPYTGLCQTQKPFFRSRLFLSLPFAATIKPGTTIPQPASIDHNPLEFLLVPTLWALVCLIAAPFIHLATPLLHRNMGPPLFCPVSFFCGPVQPAEVADVPHCLAPPVCARWLHSPEHRHAVRMIRSRCFDACLNRDLDEVLAGHRKAELVDAAVDVVEDRGEDFGREGGEALGGIRCRSADL